MNAFNLLDVTTEVTVFLTQAGAKADGLNPAIAVDADGVMCYTLYNYGPANAEVKADKHVDVAAWGHGTVPANQWLPLPAGGSVTLRAYRGKSESTNQIDRVRVRGVADAACVIGGGATEWA